MANGIARTLIVTIDGRVHTVRTNPGDYHAFVDERGQPASDEDFTYEDLLWLAHHACVRLGLTELDLAAFIYKGLDDLEVPRPGR